MVKNRKFLKKKEKWWDYENRRKGQEKKIAGKF